MSKYIKHLNENNCKQFSNYYKIPLEIVKSVLKHSKKEVNNYTQTEIPKKEKIAILISGAFFQNEKDKYGHNKPGYDYEYILKIMRNQYETYYDVDYYVCGDYKINEKIFDNKLRKSIYLTDDEIPLLPNISHLSFKEHKRYSCQYFKKKKVFNLIENYKKYKFFIWTRCDWIIVLNGFGMLDRLSTLHGVRPLPLINKKHYENIPILFQNIDLDKLYLFHSNYANNRYIYHDTFALGNYNHMKVFCYAFDSMTDKGTKGLYKYLLSSKIKLDYVNSIIVSDKIDDNYHLPVMTGYSKNKGCRCPLKCPVCYKCDICEGSWCIHEINNTVNKLKEKYSRIISEK